MIETPSPNLGGGRELFNREGIEEQQQMPDWLSLIEPQAQTLLDLSDGWDGPHSHAIDHDTLATLFDTLVKLGIDSRQLPQLAPLSSGGVQAEWHFSERSIEIGVEADGQLFAFVVRDNNYELAVESIHSFDANLVERLASHLHDLSRARSIQSADPDPASSPRDGLQHGS